MSTSPLLGETEVQRDCVTFLRLQVIFKLGSEPICPLPGSPVLPLFPHTPGRWVWPFCEPLLHRLHYTVVPNALSRTLCSGTSDAPVLAKVGKVYFGKLLFTPCDPILTTSLHETSLDFLLQNSSPQAQLHSAQIPSRTLITRLYYYYPLTFLFLPLDCGSLNKGTMSHFSLYSQDRSRIA